MIGSLLSSLFYWPVHQRSVAVLSVHVLQYFISFNSIKSSAQVDNRCSSDDEVPICLRIISIYYSPQLNKPGNKQRCKSSHVIAQTRIHLKNMALVRDTQNKSPGEACLHRVWIIMPELNSCIVRQQLSILYRIQNRALFFQWLLLTKSSEPFFSVSQVWLSLLTMTLYEVTQSLLLTLKENEGRRERTEISCQVNFNANQVQRWLWGSCSAHMQTRLIPTRWKLR